MSESILTDADREAILAEVAPPNVIEWRFLFRQVERIVAEHVAAAERHIFETVNLSPVAAARYRAEGAAEVRERVEVVANVRDIRLAAGVTTASYVLGYRAAQRDLRAALAADIRSGSGRPPAQSCSGDVYR